MKEALVLWSCVRVYKNLKNEATYQQMIARTPRFSVWSKPTVEEQKEDALATTQALLLSNHFRRGLDFYEAVLETQGLLEAVRKLAE